MVILLDKDFKEIAELLDSGQRVFVHRATGNILSHPDFDSFGGDSEEFFEDVINELDTNFRDYWEVNQLSSNDSFEIMEDFTNQLSDTNKLKEKLIKALNNRKPFANFKFEIDNSGIHRQEWFDFKSMQLKNWVEKHYNIEKDLQQNRSHS